MQFSSIKTIIIIAMKSNKSVYDATMMFKDMNLCTRLQPIVLRQTFAVCLYVARNHGISKKESERSHKHTYGFPSWCSDHPLPLPLNLKESIKPRHLSFLHTIRHIFVNFYGFSVYWWLWLFMYVYAEKHNNN